MSTDHFGAHPSQTIYDHVPLLVIFKPLFSWFENNKDDAGNFLAAKGSCSLEIAIFLRRLRFIGASVKSHSSFFISSQPGFIDVTLFSYITLFFALPLPLSLSLSFPLLSIRSIPCRTPCHPRENRQCYPAIRLSGSSAHL
jgi:hypothetical protein